jgi:hypothetical protein
MGYGVYVTYLLALTFNLAYNAEEVNVAAHDAMQVLVLIMLQEELG